MMYDKTDYLSFIELKDKERRWATEAVEQLQITIDRFRENHNIDDYKRRYAFAVNSRHPIFNHSFKESMQKFWAANKFLLRYGTLIKVEY